MRPRFQINKGPIGACLPGKAKFSDRGCPHDHTLPPVVSRPTGALTGPRLRAQHTVTRTYYRLRKRAV